MTRFSRGCWLLIHGAAATSSSCAGGQPQLGFRSCEGDGCAETTLWAVSCESLLPEEFDGYRQKSRTERGAQPDKSRMAQSAANERPRGDDGDDGDPCDPCDVPLLLELRVRGRAQVFLLAAGEDRAVAVGSAPNVDLQLAEPGILPVHLHFEREGDEIWLVPTASSGRVRVNASKLRSRCRLNQRCFVELGALTIDVRWSRQGATSKQPRFHTETVEQPLVEEIARIRHAPSMDIDYVRELPGESDVTSSGCYCLGDAAPEADFPTAQVRGLDAPSRQLVTERMPIFAPPSPPAAPLASPAPPPHEQPFHAHLSSTTQRIGSFCADAGASRAPVPDWHVLGMPMLVLEQDPQRGEPVVHRVHRHSSRVTVAQTPSLDVRRVAPTPPPPRRRSGEWVKRAVLRGVRPVSRLGEAIQARPLRLLAISFVVAMAAGTVAGGAARFGSLLLETVAQVP